VPALPYTAQPGQSILKALSDTSGTGDNRYRPDPRMTGLSSLKSAAVLTVVGAIPPDSGTTVFRPPYVGTDKPYYSTNDLHPELLPALAPVAGAPSLASIAAGVQRVQVDHEGSVTGALLRPSINMASSYWPYDAIRDINTALRLMQNDPLADKMPALLYFVQYGIDEFHIIINGQTWPGGFGIEPCHKLPLSFAAIMLNNQAMMDTARSVALRKIMDDDGMLGPGPNGAIYKT
jgi:hypothetical protein